MPVLGTITTLSDKGHRPSLRPVPRVRALPCGRVFASGRGLVGQSRNSRMRTGRRRLNPSEVIALTAVTVTGVSVIANCRLSKKRLDLDDTVQHKRPDDRRELQLSRLAHERAEAMRDVRAEAMRDVAASTHGKARVSAMEEYPRRSEGTEPPGGGRGDDGSRLMRRALIGTHDWQ